MRRVTSAVWMLVGATAAGGALVGCFPFSTPDDCEHKLLGCGGGEGGGGGGGNPICDADPAADPGAVIDDCGVFVSASAAPGGDGTKARPFASLQEAVSNANGKRVYACAEEYAETAGVTASGGVEIYGGFTECAGAWSWSASARAVLRGPADTIALTLDGGDNRVTSVEVIAASATAAGGSSIAVVASGGTLTWSGGALTAGDALDGAAGTQLDADPMLDGDVGDPGVGVCNSGANNPGPPGKTKMCATGGMSVAGKGGDGGGLMMSTALPAGDGGSGEPANAMFPTLGAGGIGEGQGSPPSIVCTDGTSGAPGAAGMSGAGATGIGTINAAGYAGVAGVAGTHGLPGQGGGGGGGARGGLNINCMGMVQDRIGASGGAGGTGGCGGTGGGAGQAGGSSIALVVLDAAVTLDGVTLAAGRGGAGGKGGDGQPGGIRGLGGGFGAGSGTANDSCGGGDGGRGGDGAPGGGGQGGHSLGIAFQGSTAPVGGEPVIDPQLGGPGGAGGLNNTAADSGKGADGMAAGCWDFAANAACGG